MILLRWMDNLHTAGAQGDVVRIGNCQVCVENGQ